MPMSGVKVVDLSRYMPGPYCAYMLGDYGAEVIKVEQPSEVAKKRKIYQQDELSPAALRRVKGLDMLSRNKQAVLLNFRKPAGRDAVKKLVARSDVFLHDYRPGVMESAGLGYEDLKQINPRLVYCAVSAFGQTGPYRDQAGHDPISLSITGVLTRFGDGPQAPREVGTPVSDLVTALHAVIGVLMALKARERTGEGQLVDVAMSDAALSLVSTPLQRLLANGVEPPPSPHMANNGLWRTKDGKFICTTDMEPNYWAKFCDMVERPDLKPRLHDRPNTDKDLTEIFLRHTRDEWFQMIRRHGTQGAPVLSLAEAVDDPHTRARGNIVETTTADGETILHIAPLIKLSATPGKIRHLARMPGDDTLSILQGLGYSGDEIAELMKAD